MKNIVKYRSHSRIENIKGVLEEKDIQYVCFSDDDYPESLKHIQMPPPILFYKGDISILDGNILSIGLPSTELFSQTFHSCMPNELLSLFLMQVHLQYQFQYLITLFILSYTI